MYRLSFTDNKGKKSLIRPLMLAASVLLDVAAFFTLIECIFGNKWFYFMLAALITASVLIKHYSQYVEYAIEYKADGERFTVEKAYPFKRITILNADVGDIERTSPCEEYVDAVKGDYGDFTIKFITVNGKAYRIAADNYMLALLGYTREDK